MTPRELAYAIEARSRRGGAPLPRAALAELMKRYPDGG
jgi:uncharacterized phage protein (TIGR02216 family)